MSTSYESRYASSPKAVKLYDTSQLRSEFLIDNLMEEGKITFTYSHNDRYIAGSAVPLTPLTLETIDDLKMPNFLDRREMSIINVGGKGSVIVEGTSYELGFKDALYIGRGNAEVIFKSDDAKNPAKFYINSAPAHTNYPTKKVSLAEANKLELGTMETANHRTVNQMIIGGIVTTCQLQMGMVGENLDYGDMDVCKINELR